VLLHALLDIFFPPLCHACGSFVSEGGSLRLCAPCMEKIRPVRAPLCTLCGMPFARAGGIDHLCSPCATSRRYFSGARSATFFEGPVKELIHRFKYGKKFYLSRPLGLLTAQPFGDSVPWRSADIIVPVPLHHRRLRQRGFNQAQLISCQLVKQWRVPLSINNLRRIRWTEPQIGLSAADREENVKNAFSVADPSKFKDKSIILVDDVYTTGSTVKECARTLKNKGAGPVWVITVARAMD
jgi:ComF family protein